MGALSRQLYTPEGPAYMAVRRSGCRSDEQSNRLQVSHASELEVPKATRTRVKAFELEGSPAELGFAVCLLRRALSRAPGGDVGGLAIVTRAVAASSPA